MSRKRPRPTSTRGGVPTQPPPEATPLRGAVARAAARRATLTALAALLAVVGAGFLAWRWWQARPAEVRREAGLSVLLVTIDTLRFDALGAYGERRPTSPWVDRLARAGVRFETAHAHNVVTLPSHANILSGLYPFEHGVRDNAGFRVPAHVETLATRLKARGYRTGAFVSGFPLDSRFGLERGFDVYDDAFADTAREVGTLTLPERAGAETAELARRWLAAADGRPTFCWVHLYDPHAPYRPPAAYAQAFADAPYLGEVAAADAAVGLLVEPLLRDGRDGRTLVIVTADHGEALGEHGERTHGLFAYESTLRVPLVVFAPRLLAPRVVRTPVRHVDLVPTVLDALALELPAGLAGRSLLPLAAGHDTGPAESYFEALSGMLGRGWAPLYGVVAGGFKYVDLPLAELYDLERDPREQNNAVASKPRPREDLLGLLRGLRAGDKGIARAEESADTRERLAALGYVTAAAAPLKKHYSKDDDPKRLVHLDDLMQQVIAHHRAGELDAALAICRDVVRQRPDMAAGLLQLALLERKLGRLDPAIAALRHAFEVNPDDVAAVVLLGSYLSEAGPEGAREAVTLLAPYAQRPDPPLDVLTTRGVALARSGRAPEALEAFERARRADPSNAMTLVQIATVHLGQGTLSAAQTSLEQALRLNPRIALAHHHLALIARARGKRDEAERRFRLALELEPADADSLLNLGLLLVEQKRNGEAHGLFERFLRVAPTAIYGTQIERVRSWLQADPTTSM